MKRIKNIIAVIIMVFLLSGCKPKIITEHAYTVYFDYEGIDAITEETHTEITLPFVESDTGFLLGWEDEDGTLYQDTYQIPGRDVTLSPVFESFDDVLDLEFGEENSVKIIKYSGNAPHIVIPQTIDDHIVRYIGMKAFEETAVQSVKIPKSFYRIALNAFSNMPNLETIDFYGDYIGTLTQIIPKEKFEAYMDEYDACIMPNTDTDPTEENPWVFAEGCPIAKITDKTDDVFDAQGNVYYAYEAEILIEYLTTIYGYQEIYFNAFEGSTALKTITLPDKLSYFDPTLFNGLENIESVTIENNHDIYTKDGIVYERDTDKLRYYPSGLLEETFTIPMAIEVVDKYALSTSKVKTLNIHENLSFEEGAFAFLYNLENIYVDDNHETLRDVDGVVYDRSEGFLLVYPAGKENPTYDILDGTTYIGSYAFAYQQFLEYLVIPEGVTFINEYAFIFNDVLHTVDLPTTLEAIQTGNFKNDERTLETLIVRRTDDEFITYAPIASIKHEDLKVYIPDDSMDTYAADMFWKYLSDNFIPLSTLEEQ